MKDQLTVSELKNYLGTELKLYMDYNEESYTDVLTGIIDDYYFTENGEGDDYELKGIKPYFFRLQDLDKFIPELGFVPIEELNRISGHGLTLYRWGSEDKESLVFDSAMHGYNVMSSFEKVQKLFQWNFWVFDQSYFKKGLIIDKLK